jgi:hypothetical protein
VPKPELTTAVDEIARAVLVEDLKDRGFRKKRWTWAYNYMSDAVDEPAVVIDLRRRAYGSTLGKFTITLWSGWVGALVDTKVGYEVLSATFLPELSVGTGVYQYTVDLANDPESRLARMAEIQSDWADFGIPWLDAVNTGPDELLAHYRSLGIFGADTVNLAVALGVDLVGLLDEWIMSRIAALDTAPPEGWSACILGLHLALEAADKHSVVVSVDDRLRAAVERLVARLRSAMVPAPLVTRRFDGFDVDLVEPVDLRNYLPRLAERLDIDVDGLELRYRPGISVMPFWTREEYRLVAAPWRQAEGGA